MLPLCFIVYFLSLSQVPDLREAVQPLRPPGQAPEGAPARPPVLVPGLPGHGHALAQGQALADRAQQRGRQELHQEGEHRPLKRGKASPLIHTFTYYVFLAQFCYYLV